MLLKSTVAFRLVALLLAGFISYLFLGFSSAAEPDEFDFLTIIFGLLLGLVSQAGLFISTTRFGARYKLLTGALMLPFFLLLVGSNYDLVSRIVEGNPLSIVAMAAYLIGIFVYGCSYVLLYKQQVAT
ncbi:Uncharacterised protein [Halioglobus japonicus]|nr:Uncharacterised protein [Halioglobus japonicus]